MPHILSFTCLCAVCSVSGNPMKHFTAHRLKRRFHVHEHDRSTVLFFTFCGGKQEDIFIKIISIFCVYGGTSIVQISGLGLVFRTRAREGMLLQAQAGQYTSLLFQVRTHVHKPSSHTRTHTHTHIYMLHPHPPPSSSFPLPK